MSVSLRAGDELTVVFCSYTRPILPRSKDAIQAAGRDVSGLHLRNHITVHCSKGGLREGEGERERKRERGGISCERSSSAYSCVVVTLKSTDSAWAIATKIELCCFLWV